MQICIYRCDRKQKTEKKRGFKTKQQAQEWERQFLTDSQWEAPETFRQLAESYLNDISLRCRQSTVITKKYVLDTKLLPFFANKRIDQITPAMIRKWQTNIISMGYKPTYLRYINSQLSAIMGFGVLYYNLKENPCTKAGAMGKAKAEEMKFWTKEEFTKFIAHVPEDSIYHCIFEILYWTGIREGELLALTPGDIDIEKNTISITKTYVKIREGLEFMNPPKTPGSVRTVFIPDFLSEELSSYLKDKASDERLFTVAKTSLRNAMIRYCKKAGTPVIRIHDLRHSHASLLIDIGFSPNVIANRLGHDNIQTTLNIYAHIKPSAKEEVAIKLQEMYSGS